MMRVLSTIFCLLPTVAFADWSDGAGYLELADRLDRPQDGYCIDVVGAGDWVDFTIPLTGHNCKVPGLYADGAITFVSPGPIRFPAYEGCVTAAGLNGRSLPGASLAVKPCAEDTDASRNPFVSASLQRFVHRDDGRIELEGGGLCLTLGEQSDSTFSSTHRWRTLFLAECEGASVSRSVWKQFAPTE